MAARTVKCAKLGRDLPALDEETPPGRQALKMALLLGGPEMQRRVREHVSAEAWKLWTEFMLMVINDYRLDPTSPDSNAVLAKQMEAFLFGESEQIPGYTPPA
jgi:Fe-S cluster biosynthesis and repair protein YggX